MKEYLRLYKGTYRSLDKGGYQLKDGTEIYSGQITFAGYRGEEYDVTKNVMVLFLLVRKELVNLFDYGEYKRTANYDTEDTIEPIKMKDITSFNYSEGGNLDFYLHTNELNIDTLLGTLSNYVSSKNKDKRDQYLDLEFTVELYRVYFMKGNFHTKAINLHFHFEQVGNEVKLVDKILAESKEYQNRVVTLERVTDVFCADTFSERGTHSYMELLRRIRNNNPKEGTLGKNYRHDKEQTRLIAKSLVIDYESHPSRMESDVLLNYLQKISSEERFFSIQGVLDHFESISNQLARDMMTKSIMKQKKHPI